MGRCNKVRLAHITAKLKSMCSVFSTTLTNVMLQRTLFQCRDSKTCQDRIACKTLYFERNTDHPCGMLHKEDMLTELSKIKGARWDSSKKKKKIRQETEQQHFFPKFTTRLLKIRQRNSCEQIHEGTILFFCSFVLGPEVRRHPPHAHCDVRQPTWLVLCQGN